MSADILRRAADLMRERAKAATPGPWTVVSDGIYYDHEWTDQGWLIYGAMIAELGDQSDEAVTAPDAEHIASWHPAVALAVADWLDSHADIHVLRTCDERLTVPCPAVTLARAYLNEGDAR